MARSSKMVRRRVHFARQLQSSLTSDAGEIARGLEERMAKVLEPGEEPPDIRHLFDVIGRMMLYEAKELEGSDEWRFDETWSLEDLRREYRQTVDSFRVWLVGLRKQMRGLIGDEMTRQLLDLKGRTPRSQEELAIYADQLYRRMPHWQMPKLRYSAVANHKVWHRQLEPMALELRALERRLVEQDSERAEALGTRDQRLATVARDLRRALRWAQLTYLLAGKDIFAGRLEAGLDRMLQSRTAAAPTAAEPTAEQPPETAPGTAAEIAAEQEEDPAAPGGWRRLLQWLGEG